MVPPNRTAVTILGTGASPLALTAHTQRHLPGQTYGYPVVGG